MPAEISAKPILAVFDFDKTLTRCDSFRIFLQETINPLELLIGGIVLSPALLGFKLGLLSRHDAKQAVARHFFKGWPVTRLSAVAEQFARQTLPKLLVPAAVERLRWHQKQGHRTILISASPEIYLIPWAKANGFDEVAATRLEVQNGLITGSFTGLNCYGPEKVCRLQQIVGELGNYTIYAYGDSRGDAEILAAANHPYYRKFSDDQ